MRTPRTPLVALGLMGLVVACADSRVSSVRADALGTPAGATDDATGVADTAATDGTATSEPTSGSGGVATTVDPVDPGDPFGWQEFQPGVETGSIEVPMDYDDPDGETFDLVVARRLADDQAGKIGTMFVNPGGPGFGGSDYALYAEQIWGPEILARFDIVGWDPRGTGFSTPAIDCIDDYDHFFATGDITPDDDVERQQLIDLAEELADSCVAQNDPYYAFVGTNNTARDIDTMRQALGEDQVTYFGFSYGSELGATWATLFPDTVRAAVLDGAADPNAEGNAGSLQQAVGFEETLATYLAQCSDDSSCAFHNDGDAEGAFDALMAELDETPIPSEPGRPDVNRTVALQGVVQAMYSDSLWPTLSEALADAQAGDGAGLLALYDSYFQRSFDGTWGNELEAFQTISCMDDPERLTVEEDDAAAPEFIEVAPRVAPGTTGSYFCTFYPPTQDPRAEITGAGAGPIVVIGTTGDAATPLSSTRAMAETLEEGRLVVVTADQHTGYGLNECVDELVDTYLVELVDPPAETEC
ncbi:MAG: alpha/beta hydrolase [Desertimonas sp.]